MKIGPSTELSRMKMLQRTTSDIRMRVDRAGYEMSTGLKANKFKATGGDLARLFAVERVLERNQAHQTTIDAVDLRLDVMQLSLGKVLTPVEKISIDLLTSTGLGDHATARLHSDFARRAFEDVVRALNVQVSGDNLFAGTAIGGAALAEPAVILGDLRTLLSGVTTAAAAEAAIDAYFGPAGAPGEPRFAGDGYLGAVEDLAALEVGDDTRLNYALRADDEKLREVLRGFAIAALATDEPFVGLATRDEQLAMMRRGGETLLAAKEGVLALRAAVGASQETLENARAFRTAERQSFELVRARIVGADGFEAASTFQAMQAQLESVFAVTARLANLRFQNFMR